MRLARFIAKSGVLSRRKSEGLIKKGRIKVNEIIVRDLSYEVRKSDNVYFDGRLLEVEDKITLALNKPKGYISSVDDEHNRQTVIDLVHDVKQRVYPVGRLDFDSRGLIILTNDGYLANKIMHPRFEVKKKYEVLLDRPIKNIDLEKIKTKKVKIDKRAVEIKKVRHLSNKKLELTIGEGRKRIIRRMFAKLGYEVNDLKRIQIGKFRLGKLKTNSYTVLDKEDIERLITKD